MSYEEFDNNLKDRKNDSITSLQDQLGNEDILFIKSSDDHGVLFNGGRRGARFSPKVIQKEVLKLARRQIQKKIFFEETCRPITIKTPSDFHSFQKDQIKKISEIVKRCNNKNIIHLGGGHDHIYTFVSALSKTLLENKNITIINFDAHLDTRADDVSHSGTPFRQLLNEFTQIELIQLGIHDYANVNANYEKLNMKIFTCEQLEDSTNGFQKDKSKEVLESIVNKISDDHVIILSVDLDGFRASDIRSVSAVNHDGLPLNFLETTIEILNRKNSSIIMGLYEYNPLYDSLATEDARKVASIIYKSVLK